MYLKRNANIKKVAFISILTAQAIVLAVVENRLPVSVGVLGIEIGLANIITLVSLVFFSFYDTILIVLIRCVVASLLMSGQVLFMFSFFGGLLSAVIMWFMLRFTRRFFSFIGISIAGSISHSIGQILVACFIISDLSVVSYLPVLMVSSILYGCCTGICSTFMVKMLKKLNLFEYI